MTRTSDRRAGRRRGRPGRRPPPGCRTCWCCWPRWPAWPARGPPGDRRPAGHRRLRHRGRGGRAALGGSRPAAHPDAVAGGLARLDRLAVGPLRTRVDLPGRRLADPGRRQLRGLGHRARCRGRARPLSPRLTQPDGIGANVTDQRAVVRDNQDRFRTGRCPARWPSRCAARSRSGRARRSPRPARSAGSTSTTGAARRPAALLSDCVLSIVDLGTVSGDGAARRPRWPRRRDPGPGARRPPATFAADRRGLCRHRPSSRLHVAIAEGPAGRPAGSPPPAPAATATSNWSTWRRRSCRR